MEKNEISVIAYNVGGLPVKLDLSDLPWYMKPISWLYKMIYKTTEIDLNTYGPGKIGTQVEADLLKDGEYDIIGLDEDFNYHNILENTLKDDYNISTWMGGLELSKFTKLIDFHWNRWPSYNIDGLCLFSKKSRVNIISENIIRWKSTYGYINHANDALMNKGFRHYEAIIDNKVNINIYLLHMDADFYDPEKCPDVSKDVEARKQQLLQLSDYIKEHNNYPSIIMGDFNSTYRYEWDKLNLKNNWTDKLPGIKDAYIECGEKTPEDIDKIFFINIPTYEYQLEPIDCYSDYNFKSGDGINMSDHNPIIAKFKYVKR